MSGVSTSKEVKIPLASLDAAVSGSTLKIRNINKTFGKILANRDISFEVPLGFIHSIVGQNGAGKSTLMKILFGLEKADSGEILFGDEQLLIDSPRDALALGIGLLQQEFSLIEELTAIENLILGNEPMRRGLIDLDAAIAKAELLQKKLNLEIPWKDKIATFSIAQKQQVEIIRLLANGANLLILDEPTAVLAPLQISAFMELLSILRKEGKTIIYISHKLREVMEISDNITVLRDGQDVGTLPIADCTIDLLANMIVGETFTKAESNYGNPQEVVLRVEELCYQNHKRIMKLKNVSAEFRSHSIMGICGVAGNGQEEFLKVLAGIIPPSSGSIILSGRDVAGKSVSQSRKLGISYISPDRKSEGLAMMGSLVENAVGGFQFILARFTWLSKPKLEAHTQNILQKYDVSHGELSDVVSSLSGGNQQRLMVGRELAHNPKVLVASQPSRGVDLGGVKKIHGFLQESRENGSAIIFASEDLDELIEISDEITVFFNGSIFGTFQHPFDRSLIGSAMMGITRHG